MPLRYNKMHNGNFVDIHLLLQSNHFLLDEIVPKQIPGSCLQQQRDFSVDNKVK
jgi:hypothetical protein